MRTAAVPYRAAPPGEPKPQAPASSSQAPAIQPQSSALASPNTQPYNRNAREAFPTGAPIALLSLLSARGQAPPLSLKVLRDIPDGADGYPSKSLPISIKELTDIHQGADGYPSACCELNRSTLRPSLQDGKIHFAHLSPPSFETLIPSEEKHRKTRFAHT